MDIAIGQFAPGTDKSDNLTQIRNLAAAAKSAVLVTPEYAMYASTKLDQHTIDAAEPLDGPFVAGLLDIARGEQLHLVAGIVERLDDETHVANTIVAAAPDGSLAAIYRKIHLYDAFGYKESDIVRAGAITDPETFKVDDLVFGLQTCYDLRFPEVTRRIVDAGADVVLLGAQWVPGPLKEDHWTTLLRARAIENTVYVAAAGQRGPLGAGNSMIVDPMGVVLGSLGERTGVLRTPITRDRITEVRGVNPALQLRRFRCVPDT